MAGRKMKLLIHPSSHSKHIALTSLGSRQIWVVFWLQWALCSILCCRSWWLWLFSTSCSRTPLLPSADALLAAPPALSPLQPEMSMSCFQDAPVTWAKVSVNVDFTQHTRTSHIISNTVSVHGMTLLTLTTASIIGVKILVQVDIDCVT